MISLPLLSAVALCGTPPIAYGIVKKLEIDSRPPAGVVRNYTFAARTDLSSAISQERVQNNYNRLHTQPLTLNKVVTLSDADGATLERLLNGGALRRG